LTYEEFVSVKFKLIYWSIRVPIWMLRIEPIALLF